MPGEEPLVSHKQLSVSTTVGGNAVLILGFWIHWVSLITAFMFADLVFMFSGAAESRGEVHILIVVLFGFLGLPDERVRPEQTREECAVIFKVCLFGEEILVLIYLLRDSSQPFCKEKFHGLKKSGYYYFHYNF